MLELHKWSPAWIPKGSPIVPSVEVFTNVLCLSLEVSEGRAIAFPTPRGLPSAPHWDHHEIPLGQGLTQTWRLLLISTQWIFYFFPPVVKMEGISEENIVHALYS